MKFEEFMSNVTKWADKRNLLHDTSEDLSVQDKSKELMHANQLLKFHEECGELTEDFNKGNRRHLMDSIGDVIVTLVIFSEQQGISMEECWDKAWSHIKDRTGKTKNGMFIKEADLRAQNKDDK